MKFLLPTLAILAAVGCNSSSGPSDTRSAEQVAAQMNKDAASAPPLPPEAQAILAKGIGPGGKKH